MSAGIFISGLVLSFIILVPLGMKWEIEKKVTIPVALIVGILCGVIVDGVTSFWHLNYYHIVGMQITIIAIISGSLLFWRFYRDPDREIPVDENAILSPADGRIIYIKKIEDGKIPFSEKNGKRFPLSDFVKTDVLPKTGTLIGIQMTFLDVHVNRAPIDGRISLLKHIKGLFISLKKKEAVVQNERMLIVCDNRYFKIGIVQIASRLVRKIIPYVKEGHEVQRGQRIGIIRFGSQVDLYLPDVPSFSIKIELGEKVKAGVSIIATFEKNKN